MSKKITIVLPDYVYEHLIELKEKKSSTMSAIVGTSVEIYNYIENEKTKGLNVKIRTEDKDGSLKSDMLTL